MTTERKSRFLEALPQLLDAVQAIDKALGREPRDDWNDVQTRIEAVLKENDSTWKKAELKLFRDVFAEADPNSQPVIGHTRKITESKVGRNKSSQFRHEPNATPLPELRKALFRPTGKFSTAGRLYGWFPLADGKTEVKYEADTALRDAEKLFM